MAPGCILTGKGEPFRERRSFLQTIFLLRNPAGRRRSGGGFGSVPSLTRLGFKSYNEKLNIAAVGVGTRGPQILPGVAPTENIVALCDVDDAQSRARLSDATRRPRSTRTTGRCSTRRARTSTR